MSDRVDEPWRDAVDVRELTEADFERRTTTIAIYDPDPETLTLVEGLAIQHDLDRLAVIDRAIRVYLAYLLDDEDAPDLRSEYDVTTLIPPRSWLRDHYGDFPAVSQSASETSQSASETERVNPSTALTVAEMLGDVLSDDESRGDLATRAIRYLAAGAPAERPSPSET